MFQRFIERGRWAILLAFVAVAAVAVALLPKTRVEFGTDVLLNVEDPDLEYYDQTRYEWGDDEYLIVCFHRDSGWFDKEGIVRLCDIDRELKALPHARLITSIATVPLLRNGVPGLLPMPVYLADSKGNPNEKINLAKAREELLEHTQALGNLISADGRDMSVLVYLDVPEEFARLEKERRALVKMQDADSKRRLRAMAPELEKQKTEMLRRRTAMVDGARALAKKWEPTLGSTRLSGLPLINVELLEHVKSDILNFGVLALGVFTLAFLAIYRRPRWLTFPMIACLIPVAVMVAAMVIADIGITVVTSNMPVLLFVLMLPYSVYFIERYSERRRLAPEESSAASSARSAAEIWSPCLYSALATMVGTAAHIASGIRPVRTFGYMMTVGTAFGLATVMLFLPASSAMLKPLNAPAGAPPPVPRGPLKLLAALVLRAPLFVVLASLTILGFSLWGTSRIQVETKFIDYFWSRSDVYRGLDYIDTRMGGTTPLEVVLVTNKPGFFRTAEGFAALDAVDAHFKKLPETGNVRSLKTLVDEVRKSMKKAKPEMVAGLLSKIAPDQVKELCNADASQARVLVRLKETSSTLNRAQLIGTLKARLAELQGNELKGVEPRVTGVCLLYSNILNGLIKTMQETFVIAIISIGIMLWIMFRSPVMAAIVLLPQILPVFLVLGVMGFAKIPLDMVTVIIASVAMGVGIDAAIQYAFRFRAELAAANGDIPEAVRRSHATIGRAILIATSIVFAGFCMLMLSHFVPTFYFGLFTGLAILMGLLASLTTLPAIFVLLKYPRLPASGSGSGEGHGPA